MYDVIIIGTATRDGFFEGIDFFKIKDRRFRVGEGICLPFGSKIEVPKVTFTTGGVGTNAATTFSRQGLKTAVICRVGSDVSGEEIIRGLRREKIDTGFIQKDFDTPTAYSVIFLTESGERTIISYKGTGEELSEKEIPWSKLKTCLSPARSDKVDKAKWFYIGSLGGNKKLLQALLSFAKNNKIKVAGNPGGRELEIFKAKPELLDNYNVLIINQEEASFLTGIPYQQEREIFEKLDNWVKGIVVMTKGPGGLAVSDGQAIWRAGTFKEKKIVDRTGAGDAFGSGFVSGLIQKDQSLDLKSNILNPEIIQYAIRLGSANATSVVEYIGAKEGIVTKNDFEKSARWNNLKISAEGGSAFGGKNN
ncbi:MAG: carbohydrate kinase family protein [Patescibacteria group bacterium]